MTDPADRSTSTAARREAPGPTEVVAIDGPSGAGKSTIARQLAQRLGFQFLDTGAMYRAVTWHFLQQGCAPLEVAGEADAGHARMRAALTGARLELRGGQLLLNGRDVSSHLRTREVESQVSAVSALPFVRAAMRDLQRGVASGGPIVAEGRDMGTVVFPQAPLKVFLTADARQRAERRHKQLISKGISVTLDTLCADLQERDARDQNRAAAPLKAAQDALLLDNSQLSIESSVAQVLSWWQARQPF